MAVIRLRLKFQRRRPGESQMRSISDCLLRGGKLSLAAALTGLYYMLRQHGTGWFNVPVHR